ncbi:MAG: Rieske (2Fe-2S) protein [Pyrinomonadaceae bacterium]
MADLKQATALACVEDLKPGTSACFTLDNGEELVIYNVDGEFYAIENSCPHRGAPLSEGSLCGNVVECALHGWQFDVRTGECLTVDEKIRTYGLVFEDGLVKADIK